MKARDASDRFRACPPGQRRGIDVQRMYGEIRAIVVATFGANPPVPIDDLVQETARAIHIKNGQGCVFDPERSSFAHYVVLVARSKVGHMLGSSTRRAVVYEPQEALDRMPSTGESEAGGVEASATTVGDLVEQLAELGRGARGAGRAEVAEGLRLAAELVATAFDEEQLLPLPRRVRALLTIAARPLTAAQVAAALLVAEPSAARALERLLAAGVVLQRARGFELAGAQPLPVAPRPRRGGVDVAERVVAMRLTEEQFAELQRLAAAQRTTVGLFARALVLRAALPVAA